MSTIDRVETAAFRLILVRQQIKYTENDIERFRGSKIDDGPQRIRKLEARLADLRELYEVLSL